MFRPRSMDQVEILFLRRDMKATLKALAAAGIIHLYRIGAGEDRDTGDAGQFPLERYRDFALRAFDLAGELGIDVDCGELIETEDFPAWEEWLEGLRERLARIRRDRDETRRRRLRLIATALLLRQLSSSHGTYAQLVDLRLSSLRLGLLSQEALFQLNDLPGGCRVYTLARFGLQRLVAVLCLQHKAREMERMLHGLSFVPIPIYRRVRGEIGDVEPRIRRLLARHRRREQRLDRRVEGLRRRYGPALRDRLYSVRVEMHLLEQQRSFGYTRRTVGVGGWVPASRRGELEGILNRTCSGHFHIRGRAARGDETPVLLSNPRLMRPFEKVLEVYGTPSYREIEPTPLLTFAFMVLFGMMFGDLGHGLVLLLAGLAIRRWTRWPDEGMIMAEVGCFAALFGVLFGSFFGWEGLFEPLWFSPMQDIPRLMGAALVLGVGLMTAGMALRVVNGLRRETFAAVFTDRYGVAGIVFYLGSLAVGYLVYRSALPATLVALLGLPLAGVFLHPFFDPAEKDAPRYLQCAEGIIEVIETVLGFLANTFSFLRVAAFGLAHVGLSLAVFALAEEALELPFGLLFAGLVHILGNLVILVLEGLIVSIQTIRLEFYEFFGKFFRGEGIRFRPLSLDPYAERRT